jgi:hypothetical protein
MQLRVWPRQHPPPQRTFGQYRIGQQHCVLGRAHTPSPAGGPDLPVADAELVVVKYGEKSLGRTADQDLGIAAGQQAGLHSAGFMPFYLAHQERRVQNFHERLNDFLARPA